MNSGLDIRCYTNTFIISRPDTTIFSGYIIGDSRTWRIDERDWRDCVFNQSTFLSMRGAEVNDIRDDLFSTLLSRDGSEFSSVKLCLGLNNILNGHSPASVFEDLLEIKRQILRRCDNILVSFADIAPVNLDVYVGHRPLILSNTQANSRIVALNELIYKENLKIYRPFLRPASTPFLSKTLVRSVKANIRGQGRRISTVQLSFLRDGLHGTDKCKVRWVKTLKSSLLIDFRTLMLRQQSIN